MLRPDREADLAQMVRAANGPLAIQGGGTRHVPGPGAALTTAGLSGITLYEPGALTLVAQAGTPMAEIEAALAAENQTLPFEPMDHRPLLGRAGAPTIGGAVAMNVSGPRRVQAGACRDSLIGVRFVDGEGSVVKNGGRVMKNVTGYDLVKLLAGSRGRLGVLTEVSFKVLPIAARQMTLALGGLSVAEGVRAMAAALGSPFEVTAAAHDPQAGETLLRLEGLDGSVAYRAEALAKHLAAFGAVTQLAPEASVDRWAQIRDGVPIAGEGDLWRVSVRASLGPDVVARAGAKAALLDWGGGLVWLRTEAGADLRARLQGVPGEATCLRGGAPARHPKPAPIAALEAGLVQKFDPKGLFGGLAA